MFVVPEKSIRLGKQVGPLEGRVRESTNNGLKLSHLHEELEPVQGVDAPPPAQAAAAGQQRAPPPPQSRVQSPELAEEGLQEAVPARRLQQLLQEQVCLTALDVATTFCETFERPPRAPKSSILRNLLLTHKHELVTP